MVNGVGRIEVRTVKSPKTSAKSIVIISIGALFLLISVLFILSIIMIIPGFFGLLVGFFIIYAGIQRTTIECMACGQPIKVMVNAKSGECEHCKTANPLIWTD